MKGILCGGSGTRSCSLAGRREAHSTRAMEEGIEVSHCLVRA